ncbi:HdeA/HdeB family chaperone [Shewanella schlegeliana]|uniref:HdeA/HdeB family chaperone n=1 Tax=Shewanella schlegeliana TaxID=190308 RepID=UPI001ED920CB|nr:HdeA/HdeB family chaperone [Shewanella schlegeliana]
MFLAAALSIFPAAQADVTKETKAKDMTCAQFLDVDFETIPVVVGYLYRYNEWTGDIDVVQVDVLDDVDIDELIDYLQKNLVRRPARRLKNSSRPNEPE